ncbi:MAG TPA: hypothetical protein VF591_23965 [Pyrinomonadaceae bacterium]|jgi:hypothetical protein
MSQQPDPPIVVSGGSVTIEFDETIFTKNGNGKHSNANKRISRVEVTVNGNTQTFSVPNGKVTVAIHYGNP